MLKSHFNLAGSKGDEEEEEHKLEEEHKPEEEHVPDTVHEEQMFFTERVLKKSEVSVRLGVLGKTAEGDGYTYLKATLIGMSLTDIKAIKCFQHIQFVDVSNNLLTLKSLQAVTELPFLVLIHADKNLLNSANLNKMKYLQVIIMNNNTITSVHDVFQPELSTLEVGYNSIRKIFFENRMPNIKCLDFQYNMIEDILDLDFPKLDSLYLAGNKIKSLVGLERLVNLRILHVRNNPIKLLNGFDAVHTKLQYVNLRNCKVTTLKQIKKLQSLSALETLIVKGCPYMGGMGEEDADAVQEEEDPEIRIEILATLQRLKRINKGFVTPEERTEAKDLMMQWLEEGEKDEEEGEEEQVPEEQSID